MNSSGHWLLVLLFSDKDALLLDICLLNDTKRNPLTAFDC